MTRRIGTLARETGVDVATIRAWERRYGVPTATRTRGGHRVYGPDAAAQIRQIVDLTAAGMHTREAAAVVAGRREAPENTAAQVAALQAQVASLTDEVVRLRTGLAVLLAGQPIDPADAPPAPAPAAVGHDPFDLRPRERTPLEIVYR